jgi:hypothetical protein
MRRKDIVEDAEGNPTGMTAIGRTGGDIKLAIDPSCGGLRFAHLNLYPGHDRAKSGAVHARRKAAIEAAIGHMVDENGDLVEGATHDAGVQQWRSSSSARDESASEDSDAADDEDMS